MRKIVKSIFLIQIIVLISGCIIEMVVESRTRYPIINYSILFEVQRIVQAFWAILIGGLFLFQPRDTVKLLISVFPKSIKNRMNIENPNIRWGFFRLMGVMLLGIGTIVFFGVILNYV